MAMTEKLAFQLRKENKLTSNISVKIRYSDFDTHTKQMRIPYTSTDHTLMKVVKELFDKLFERRGFNTLGWSAFSGLVSGGYQINLLEDSESIIQLYQEMDFVRKDTAIKQCNAFRQWGMSLNSLIRLMEKNLVIY